MTIPWIYAHLIGDFLLQNHWMQKKGRSHWHCAVHVAFYLIPFVFVDVAWWKFILIGLQHYAQDRYGWAASWGWFWRQSPPSKWPSGRLIVDQVMHVLFLAFITGSLRP